MCKITESVHSHFPVARGGVDTILGMVYVKDLLVCDLTEEPALADAIGPVDLKAILRPPLFVPESMLALRV